MDGRKQKAAVRVRLVLPPAYHPRHSCFEEHPPDALAFLKPFEHLAQLCVLLGQLYRELSA